MLEKESLNSENLFNRQSWSEKELALFNLPQRLRGPESVNEISEQLLKMGFVRCEGGKVKMGRDDGLECSIEGNRLNEVPAREIEIPPFYISKYTVSNIEYEKFDSRHSRTNTSKNDKSPVTCLTYGKAIGYALWLSEQTGLAFTLPTEPQFVAVVAPLGWEYPYQEDGPARVRKQNHFRAFQDKYPLGELGATLEVDDDIVPPNYLGLYHATGNVSVFSLGYYPTAGHYGASTDGSYVVALGGNFRLCPLGARTVTRGIMDVTGISDTVGIRLVHPDPEIVLKNNMDEL
jgi:formylglycine-generating enzyme required for sulfatase activity